mmetsp:Transcript_107919/g.315546  ORF Transcript_107919/g.315546 Transcript_107919/m.315546 type:complete len:207 (+) Transcript_107919:1587-2207(+)
MDNELLGVLSSIAMRNVCIVIQSQDLARTVDGNLPIRFYLLAATNHGHVRLPRQDHAYRKVLLECNVCTHGGQVCGVKGLAAEASTNTPLGDRDLVLRQARLLADGLMHIVGALVSNIASDATLVRYADAGLVLHVEVGLALLHKLPADVGQPLLAGFGISNHFLCLAPVHNSGLGHLRAIRKVANKHRPRPFKHQSLGDGPCCLL